MATRIDREGIAATHAVIAPHVRLTPVVTLDGVAAFAALLGGGYTPIPGEQGGVLISGGNTTAVEFGGQAPATTRA